MESFDASAPLDTWLEGLDRDTLQGLILDAARRMPELHDWLETQRVADAEDPTDLLGTVDKVLKPTRRFYEYGQANRYAADAHPIVELLEERASHATPGLLPVIERAITLVTRAILKSDTSSGAQGDLVHSLLTAHAQAARTSSPPLDQKEQTRLVKWIVKYRYGGQQDFFDPDVVAYAPALSATSIEHYRKAITGTDLGPYGSYPLTRLAVLDRNAEAIVAANGGEPHNAMLAARIVSDLDEAGLHEDAVDYARRGLAMETRGWDQKLVTFLVDDALSRGDHDHALALRRDWFTRFPTSTSFGGLRRTAEEVGAWEKERAGAEELLARRDPASLARYLLGEDRVDEAWNFASDRIAPAERADVWLDLCERRRLTHPADTLPVYREIIDETLTVTHKRNYRAAAQMLKTMRSVADAAGTAFRTEFDTFLARTVEQNRRRPTCIDAFARAGLIDRR